MRKHVKAIFGVAAALLLVIAVGMTLSDHSLKATDGDENIVEEETVADETVEDEETTEEESEDIEAADTEEDLTEEEETEAEEASTDDTTDTTSSSKGEITISSNLDIDSPVEVGEKVTLTANVSGYDGTDYTFQWSRSLDGETWEDIEGANSAKYTFTMDEDNSGYQWRVRLIEE